MGLIKIHLLEKKKEAFTGIRRHSDYDLPRDLFIQITEPARSQCLPSRSARPTRVQQPKQDGWGIVMPRAWQDFLLELILMLNLVCAKFTVSLFSTSDNESFYPEL
jgi:hypothetical protein